MGARTKDHGTARRRTMLRRITVGATALGLLVAGPGAAADPGPTAVSAPHDAPPEDWLGAVNFYREQSGVPAVRERAEWSRGILAHLHYLATTPREMFTGQYANAHTENPQSPAYTAEGDAAGRASNLGGGSTDLEAIEVWIGAPFHAIGILRAGLREAAFGRRDGSTGLDVIRGIQQGGTRPLVLFPGPGGLNFLDRFLGELPDPRDPCGPGFEGLPLFAMLPSAPPAGTTATHTLPSGRRNPQGRELCVVTAATWRSGDSVYGPTGGSILSNDNVVLVIPREPLAPGTHAVSITLPGRAPVEWSFTQVPSFGDVPYTSPLLRSIRWLAANDITRGVAGSDRFDPGGAVTRGQMALFLHRLFGAPDPAGRPAFDDVPPGSTYADAVQWLVEQGVTSGVAGGRRFDVGGRVTRSQMASFLHRLAGSPAASGGRTFSDVPPGAFYAGAVQWLSENEITQGLPGSDRFDPGGVVTRGQMASFLFRFARRA